MYEAKRLMGRSFWDESVQSDKDQWDFEVVNDDSKPVVKVDRGRGIELFTAEQISHFILKKMKHLAEERLRRQVTQAVITVPVYFGEVHRTATLQAARMAGLTSVTLVPEPKAAAVAFAVDRVERGESRTVLVYDLGGGTFDVTVLQVKDKDFVVRGYDGNAHLGGADFDQRLLDMFLQEIEDRHGRKVDEMMDHSSKSRLRAACEKAKISLSSCESAVVELECLIGDEDFKSEVTRREFEDMCYDLFQETIEPIERVLAAAGLVSDQIDDLVLVGGSSKIPKLRQIIGGMFPSRALASRVNADEAVAYGAVICAAMQAPGDGIAALVLPNKIVDVTPLSLGVFLEGNMDVIIPKNTQIFGEGTQMSKFFTTKEDNQTSVRVRVFQGERPVAEDNVFVGELVLDGIQPKPKAEACIKVTFKIDANGVLTVYAWDCVSDARANVRLDNSAVNLSEERVQELLQEAERFHHQDELIKQRISVRNELRALCSRHRHDAKHAVSVDHMVKWWDANQEASLPQLQQQLKDMKRVLGLEERLEEEACDKVLACGHLCCGVRGQACVPCLQADCSRAVANGPRQLATDQCPTCLDELSSAPCVHLACSHVVHVDCARQQLAKGYRVLGSRITFAFLACPHACGQEMEHPSLAELMQPIRSLKVKVQQKALMRLQLEKKDKDAQVERPNGRFYRNPTGYAMHLYAYYECHKCQQPYFGGEARCLDGAAAAGGDGDAGAEAERELRVEPKPEDLVCGPCSSPVERPICQKHGPDFQGYKCRFCCSMAVFFCFGTTHFCEKCHSLYAQLTSRNAHPDCPVGPGSVPLPRGSACPLRVRHKATGQEVYLGCSVCIEQASC